MREFVLPLSLSLSLSLAHRILPFPIRRARRCGRPVTRALGVDFHMSVSEQSSVEENCPAALQLISSPSYVFQTLARTPGRGRTRTRSTVVVDVTEFVPVGMCSRVLCGRRAFCLGGVLVRVVACTYFCASSAVCSAHTLGCSNRKLGVSWGMRGILVGRAWYFLLQAWAVRGILCGPRRILWQAWCWQLGCSLGQH